MFFTAFLYHLPTNKSFVAFTGDTTVVKIVTGLLSSQVTATNWCDACICHHIVPRGTALTALPLSIVNALGQPRLLVLQVSVALKSNF